MNRQRRLPRAPAVCTAITAVTALLATAPAGHGQTGPITDKVQLFQAMDTDGDGIVRETEIGPHHQRLFQRLVRRADTDNDGGLNAHEWQRGFEGQRIDRPLETLPEETSEEDLPAAVFAQLDQDRNGSLAQDEVPPRVRANWDDVLKLADGNGDGRITRNEFMRRYPRLAHRFKNGVDRIGQLTPEMFGRLDADGDGVVRLDELPDERRQQLLRLFSLADQNADGGLDKDEVEAGLAALRRMMAEDLPVQRKENANQPDRTAAEIIERAMRLDVSGDGQVGRDEARGPLAKQFQQIDSDGNGALDRGEISRAARRFMEQRRQEN